ncbi:nucleotidyltransferase domain-containing protein [Rhizobium sp. NZLR8]|uniref:nucleotidyltransferase domain-containing protein n=1 Tax=Rhizobium sp. NZLR8 TaxID=2731104 RepID=UPI002180C1D4|nr:nucleotidyltransferase domain-containing protein [Rhizobium sp. NZLR8]
MGRELVSIGGPGVGAGRRVIQAFDQSGIVVKSSRGNQILYAINTHSPIYGELRSICVKTLGLADVVARELASFGNGIELAFLFGSVVVGKERADSDVDLMVVSNMDVFDFAEALKRMEDVLGRAIDLNLHIPAEWKGLAGDRVVNAIVNGAKIVVIER